MGLFELAQRPSASLPSTGYHLGFNNALTANTGLSLAQFGV